MAADGPLEERGVPGLHRAPQHAVPVLERGVHTTSGCENHQQRLSPGETEVARHRCPLDKLHTDSLIHKHPLWAPEKGQRLDKHQGHMQKNGTVWLQGECWRDSSPGQECGQKPLFLSRALILPGVQNQASTEAELPSTQLTLRGFPETPPHSRAVRASFGSCSSRAAALACAALRSLKDLQIPNRQRLASLNPCTSR